MCFEVPRRVDGAPGSRSRMAPPSRKHTAETRRAQPLRHQSACKMPNQARRKATSKDCSSAKFSRTKTIPNPALGSSASQEFLRCRQVGSEKRRRLGCDVCAIGLRPTWNSTRPMAQGSWTVVGNAAVPSTAISGFNASATIDLGDAPRPGRSSPTCINARPRYWRRRC